MLVPMAKVRIVGLRSDRERALAVLHELGLLEIAPADPRETTAIPRRVQDQRRLDALTAAIDRIAALIVMLPPGVARGVVAPEATLPNDGAATPTEDLLAGATRLIDEIGPAAATIEARRASLEAELASLRTYGDILERLLPLTGSLTALESFETVALIVRPGHGAILDPLRAELDRITERRSELLFSESADGSIAALIVVDRRRASAVHALLQGEQLTEVRLPADIAARPFRETLDRIARRQGEIPREIADLRAELAGLLEPRRGPLAAWQDALLDRRDEIAAARECLESDRAFVLLGWTPERDVVRLERALADALAGRILVERLAPTENERADIPVLVENPALLRPFQALLRIGAPPRYGTVDPTPFLAFFVPLFFGLMVGDIGYGLVLLTAATAVRRRAHLPAWARDATRMLTLAAISTVAFGIAFGEVFGDLGRASGLRPLIVERETSIEPLLLFSVALGAAQVTLGLVLGVVSDLLERRRLEGLSRAATLLGLVAVIAVIAAALDVLPHDLLRPSVGALIVALVTLLYTVGIVGPLELVGVLGSVLSYTRLVAVGLASVILARVANQLAGDVGNVVLGIVVGVLFHALNLTLGLVSPTIQTLRLQYVEFFRRFQRPGARPFAPFRSRSAAA